jgi:hypothetical protein
MQVLKQTDQRSKVDEANVDTFIFVESSNGWFWALEAWVD